MFGFGAARGPADDADHVVQMIERNLVADENVLALFRFAQLVARAANDDVAAVFEKQLDQRNQAEFARLAAHDREQDHAEGLLHLRVLEKIVEDKLRFFAALDFYDDAHAFAGRFVANVGDTFDFLGLHQLGDAFDQLRFVYLIRNFSDYDILAVFSDFFDGGFGAHHEAAAPGFVSG